ncbi:MAG: DUF1566 domain-containing protein [Burkholderiales bacterium]|nr:DUF1566 domain-containing protein [Burkholderiales bacterium]
MSEVLAPLTLATLPALKQPLDAGLFAGVITQPDGKHCAVVLLADKPTQRLVWKDAMAWAESVGGQLPTRPVAAMLFANAKDQFEEAWHWTPESFDGSYAWVQFFDGGYQYYGHKSYEGRARAVRLIQLDA